MKNYLSIFWGVVVILLIVSNLMWMQNIERAIGKCTRPYVPPEAEQRLSEDRHDWEAIFDQLDIQ